MPATIEEIIKRNIVQQWLGGYPRDKIAAENKIGARTVSSIVNDYKVGLEDLEFDCLRELAVELRKQGLNFSDLSSHVRLYNFIKKLGAAEEARVIHVQNSI
jgi:hypothetical protein